MKVLLYSYVFLPSLGGIEIVSATLAEHLVKLGCEVTVVTETASQQPDTQQSYKIVRCPSLKERIALVRTHDVVHANGASMALFFYAKLLRKPFLWTHGGYQLSCVDGLGWVEGNPAPLSPWKSILFHKNRRGVVYAAKEAFKLYLRRWAGSAANANVAVTQWVAMRQPLPKQKVIYNPFPLGNFSQIPRTQSKEFDFIYVGRLVSEKGVPDLVRAFALLHKQHGLVNTTLALVGDGNWRTQIEALAQQLGVSDKITFFGKRFGQELYDVVAKAQIAVVPSIWEEPMGGVALELMAAGKNIIVSKNGGLAECVGEGAILFENGDASQLADCMKQLYEDKTLQQRQLNQLKKQLESFDPLILSKEYLSLYCQIA